VVESVSRKVKLYVPTAVEVPVIAPVEAFRFMPIEDKEAAEEGSIDQE
jgi:hypothetical protein